MLHWALLCILLLLNFSFLTAQVICYQPEVPENCHVVYDSDGPAVSGSKVRYQCNAGFIRFGPEERVCGKDGRWKDEVPVCAINVAKYRPVGLSGSLGNLSVDGDFETCSEASNRLASDPGQEWWDVDLLHAFQIFAVQIVYRTGKKDPSEAHTFVCAGKPVGTHVTLRTSQPHLLNLCEVMVLTTHAASYWQCGSMTGTVAWGAFEGSCYHSSLDAQPWFSASSHCSAQHGSLPEHITIAQHRYMVSELQYRGIRSFPGYWVGLVSDAVGRWVYTSDGKTPTDTFWDDPKKASSRALPKEQNHAVVMHKDSKWAWTPYNQQAWNYWICKADIQYCGSPGIPENGGVIISSQSYSPGVEAYYYCRDGFVVHGPETRACLSNGTWSGDSPTCQPVVCGSIPVLANGLTTHMNDSSVLGSQVQFECRHGFVLKGPRSRFCQPSGLWSGSQPFCLEIACGQPEEIPHGSFQYTDGPHKPKLDSQVQYSCQEGYKLIGDPVRTCLGDGTWIPDVPVCLDMHTLQAAIGEHVKKPVSLVDESAQVQDTNKTDGLSSHATNLIASFIAVVVVMVIAVSLVVLWVWKRRFSLRSKIFPPSNSNSGRSSANGSSSLSSHEILYAFTSPATVKSDDGGGKDSSVYQLTSDLSSSRSNGHDQNHYDVSHPISLIAESNIYASPSSVAPPCGPESPQPLYYSTINPQQLANSKHQKLVLLLTDESMLQRLQQLPPCATLPRHLSRQSRALADSDSSETASRGSNKLHLPNDNRMSFLTIRGKPLGCKVMDRPKNIFQGWMSNDSKKRKPAKPQTPLSPGRERVYDTNKLYGTTRSRKDVPRPRIPPPPVPNPGTPGEHSNINFQSATSSSRFLDEPERCETPDSQLFNFSDDEASEGGQENRGAVSSSKSDTDGPPTQLPTPKRQSMTSERSEVYDLPPEGASGLSFHTEYDDNNIYEELPRGVLTLPKHLSKANIETDYTVC